MLRMLRRVTAAAVATVAITASTGMASQTASASGSFSCGGTSYTTSWTGKFGGGDYRWLIGYDASNNRVAKLTVLSGGSANLFIADWRETGWNNPDLAIGSESNGMSHCHYVRPRSNTVDFEVRRGGKLSKTGLAFPSQS